MHVPEWSVEMSGTTRTLGSARLLAIPEVYETPLLRIGRGQTPSH